MEWYEKYYVQLLKFETAQKLLTRFKELLREILILNFQELPQAAYAKPSQSPFIICGGFAPPVSHRGRRNE